MSSSSPGPSDSVKEGPLIKDSSAPPEGKILKKVDEFSNAFDKIYGLMLKLLKLSLLFCILVFAYRFITYQDEGIVIRPLDNNIDGNFSGAISANRLEFELQKIKEISEQKINYGSNATLAQNPITPINLEMGKIYHDPGPMNIGDISLSPAKTFFFLKDIAGNSGQFLTLEFQKFGNNLSILAVLNDPQLSGKDIHAWEESQTLSDNNQSVEDLMLVMIENLAYRIAYDLTKMDSKSSRYPLTLSAFRKLTEAKAAYLKYTVTHENNTLNESRNLTLNAIEADWNYDDSYNLLYLIGKEYVSKKNYAEGRRLYEIVNKNDKDLSSIGLANIHFDQDQFVEATKVIVKAIKRNGENSWLWYNKGRFLKSRNLSKNASYAFNKAIEFGKNDKTVTDLAYKQLYTIEKQSGQSKKDNKNKEYLLEIRLIPK
jgi:tetratricopeptide (TPR) repeat protein